MLISAGLISYLGAFTTTYRDQVCTRIRSVRWTRHVHSLEQPVVTVVKSSTQSITQEP